VLGSLLIRNVRNIIETEICPADRINLIVGNNGCGKTAVLESIFLLGRGRSFRTSNIREIINHNSKSLIVSGKISQDEKKSSRIGLKIDENRLEIKIDDEQRKDRTELVRNLPTQIIYPGSFGLLDEGPGNRRKFLDYGLFHMEQSSLNNWKKYNRALRQRNVLLKQACVHQLEPWRIEMNKYGELLNDQRKNYLKEFEQYFLEIASELLPFKQYEFSFFTGWARDRSLNQVLKDDEKSDLILGFTRNGPHRADFKIKVNGRNVKSTLSRGQMKVLIFTIKMAQVKLSGQFLLKPPCILIDDLASELDTMFKGIVMDYLKKFKTQIFITATDIQSLGQGLKNEKMFHVEQGSFFSK